MASVDQVSTGDDHVVGEAVSTPNLSWDSTVSAVALEAGWNPEPLILDWFGAKEADLLVTAGGGDQGRFARIYRPLPTSGDAPRKYDAGTPVEALKGLRCVCALPNGAESRFDLVALAADDLVWLPNSGDAHQPRFESRSSLGIAADLGLGPCRIVQIVAEDWDGDRLADLLIGLDDLSGYWPDGERLPLAQQVGFNQKGGHPGYDQKGLWRGQAPRGRLFWLRNTGRPGSPEFAPPAEVSSDGGHLDLALHPSALSVAWGGGGSELLVTDVRGVVHIHRNFGGQRPPILMEARTLRCGHGPLQLADDRTTLFAADIDGDRRPELVYGTSDGRIFAVHSGRTRDDAKTPVPFLQEPGELRLGGHAVLTSADLDGDGDLDLVYGDAPGRLHYLQDLGSGSDHRYAEPVVIEAGGVPFRLDPGPDGMQDGPAAARLGFSCPTLCDWTGNGRLSLLVGGAGGEVLYLRNDGAANSPRFGSPAPLRCEGAPLIIPPRVRPAVAEWNEPGKLDLIALDLQGFLSVYPRAGTVDLAAPIPLVDRLGRVLRLDGGFGQAGRVALWAGTWTGSGLIDLLVGIPRGNRHIIPALTGEPISSVDELPTVLLFENLGHGRLSPRPLRHADGRPVVFGFEGCSPSGADVSGQGSLDLLVGSDDGAITVLRRGDLRW